MQFQSTLMLKKAIRTLKDGAFFAPILFLVDLLLLFTDFLATLAIRDTHSNKICIIKLDKLGDYILIRNFLRHLKESEKYKDHPVTFIGNKENKIFAEYLDKGEFDNFIWIDIYKYSTNPLYRFKVSRSICKEGFQISIAPTYARVLVLDDYITLVTKAKIRIGQVTHLINIKKWEAFIGNYFYTSLIKVSDEVIFEFERNRLFFEQVTLEDLSNLELRINIPAKTNNFKEDYVVIMPGAADKFREWSSENYAKVADYLILEKRLTIVLCGSPSEREIGENIIGLATQKEKIINKMGALQIDELFNSLNNAEFILSNETGAVHVVAALNKTVISISNGNHFKKYTEYPERLNKKVHYIYPPEVEVLIAKNENISRKFDTKSNVNINSISVYKVIDFVSNFFTKKI